ncbi:putative drug resistance protein [Rosellinia necatrix]|uniref:Putative drug resistance protein n=1 Tax=Rosellinia necatrix TaxID=77044 RepID=A0A1W2TQV6_ROSNE|nr:putative drug resistance protein [Rosellinia necatrix]
MTEPSVMNSGVVPSSTHAHTTTTTTTHAHTDAHTDAHIHGTSTPASIPDKAEIERLARQRPAIFRNAYAEYGFVLSVILSMMMCEYFISGFNIVLPEVAVALDIADAQRTWPAAVPNLTTAALLLPFARLCDLYGGRPVFLAGHAWAFVWSLAAGFSPDPTVLIVCRAMQGVGFSAFLPAGLALLGHAYRPGPRKNLVYSVYGAFACVGFYFGILVGALAGQFLTWRWYFYIGAVLLFLVIAVGLLTIPRDLGDRVDGAAMDWWGLATVVPGLVLVVYAFSDGGHAPDGWRTPYIYVTLVVGVLFLAAFVYVEGWVAAQPLLPVEVFKPKYMKRLSVGLFCSYGIFGLFLFYASYYVETVLHTTPLQTAAWFIPLAGGGFFIAVIGGFVLHILSGRILMAISSAGYLLCCLLFALLPAQSNNEPSTSFLYWAYVFPAMLAGTIGVDITFNVTNVYITTAMPRRLQATAGALLNSLLYLGIAFWLGIGDLAIATSVRQQGEDALPPREQYQIAFWTGVGLAVVSFLCIVTVDFGRAEAQLTVDEKADLDGDESQS